MSTSLHRLSWIEISSSALWHNITVLGTYLYPAQLWWVAKSNAYGHGIAVVLESIAHHPLLGGICVETLEEAAYVRKKQYNGPLMVLTHGYEEEVWRELHTLSACGILQSYEAVASYAQYYTTHSVSPTVHLGVDTGMMRLGIRYDDMHASLDILSSTGICLPGVMTHLADKDTADQSRTFQQCERFAQCCRCAQDVLTPKPVRHVLSSGALEYHSLYPYEAVRVGLNIYGLYSSPYSQGLLEGCLEERLQPVLSWKTRVAYIKEVRAGEYVGYGSTFRAERGMRIAIVPVGYNDGLFRCTPTTRYVRIGSAYAPLVGVVNMNLTLIDATSIPNIRVGDEVEVIGGSGLCSADAHATASSTISYEITASLRSSLPRNMVHPLVRVNESPDYQARF